MQKSKIYSTLLKESHIYSSNRCGSIPLQPILTRSYAKSKGGKGGKDSLKAELAKLIPEERDRFLGIKCLHGNKVIGKITVNSVIGGMRGLPLLVCTTSR